MRKPQHSISGKLLTVLLIFALPITIFLVQHTRGVYGTASSPTATPTPTQVSAPTEQPVTNVTTRVNQTNGSNTANQNQNDNNNTTNNVTAVVEAAAQATPTATPTPTPVQTTGIWKPALNTSWQWQLTTPLDQSINVAMYDVDGFDNTASIVSSLHAQGRKVVCYIDAGTYENWRSDANQFPSSVKGSGVQGWAGEQWLDIRNLNVLGPIMQARLDMCKSKGFDGVEFDNVDGYTNNTGFPLTAEDQLTYNTWLANEAHVRGMSAGLKNDLDQVKQLLPYFDWALDEQCFQYNECDKLTPFISAGKAVFEVEYDLQPSQFCNQANAMNFNSLKKNLDLDAPRTACR